MQQGKAFTIKQKNDIKRKVLEYLVKTPGCKMGAACQQAGVSYAECYSWRKEEPDFDEQIKSAYTVSHSLGGDFAESKLMEAIKNNNMTGIIFYLKTQHKARGYVEQDENAVPPANITLNFNEEMLYNMLDRYSKKLNKQKLIEGTTNGNS